MILRMVSMFKFGAGPLNDPTPAARSIRSNSNSEPLGLFAEFVDLKQIFFADLLIQNKNLCLLHHTCCVRSHPRGTTRIPSVLFVWTANVAGQNSAPRYAEFLFFRFVGIAAHKKHSPGEFSF
jgi:hypothetical protein